MLTLRRGWQGGLKARFTYIVNVSELSISMSVLTVLIPLTEALGVEVAALLGLETLVDLAELDRARILLHLHWLLHHLLLLGHRHLLLHILLARHLLLGWVEHMLGLLLLVGHALGGLGVELGLGLGGSRLRLYRVARLLRLGLL